MIVRLGVLGVAGALTLSGASVAGQRPRELLLFRAASGSYDLVSVNEDGSGIRVLVGESKRTVKPTLFTGGSWSPDGTSFAFTGQRSENAPPNVYVAQADGSSVRRLSRTAGDDPAWSPDGRRVAFTSGPGTSGASDVYVADANGSNLRRLTKTCASGGPVWSPDGRTLAFGRALPSDRPTSSAVWAVDADGRNLRDLVPAAPGVYTLPVAWSPDGSKLLFVRGRPVVPEGFVRNTSAVYVVRKDGTGLRKLADRASEPAWSPDGRRIAFITDRDRNGTIVPSHDIEMFANELYVMDADGRNVRRLTWTRKLNEGSPAWAPDGGRIAYDRGKEVGEAQATSVLSVLPDGRDARMIASDPQLETWYAEPAWRPRR